MGKIKENQLCLSLSASVLVSNDLRAQAQHYLVDKYVGNQVKSAFGVSSLLSQITIFTSRRVDSSTMFGNKYLPIKMT